MEMIKCNKTINGEHRKFSKYFNRGSGGSEPTLNCRSHHKERFQYPFSNKGYLNILPTYFYLLKYTETIFLSFKYY